MISFQLPSGWRRRDERRSRLAPPVSRDLGAGDATLAGERMLQIDNADQKFFANNPDSHQRMAPIVA
jgi:hypothetical protein